MPDAVVLSVAPPAGVGVFPVPRAEAEMLVENVAKLLDAGGAEGGWRGYALAGGALGAASACVAIVHAQHRGDRAATGAALLKLGEATLGLVETSGLLHARPGLAGAVKITSTLLGKIGDAVKPAEAAADPVARYRTYRTLR